MSSETPLVATLREIARLAGTEECAQAADLIERQSAELATLRGKVERLSKWQEAVLDGNSVFAAMAPTTLTASDISNVLDAVAKVARAALSRGL